LLFFSGRGVKKAMGSGRRFNFFVDLCIIISDFGDYTSKTKPLIFFSQLLFIASRKVLT
jgi:hypothetical protein